MISQSQKITSIFNDQFFVFINDIQQAFPDDVDIATANKSLQLVRKANPKLLSQAWMTYIVSKYKSEIQAGNIHFFLQKDYSEDISGQQNADKIMEAINRLRDPIQKMSTGEQEKTMLHIQNLTTLAEMCSK